MVLHERLVIPHLRATLVANRPQLVDPADFPTHSHAAVALILRETTQAVEILFILRATSPRDPWSGNIAFPGGHIERDETPRAAAERETAEELGIDLTRAECLGRLDDVAGAHLPVIVSCFAYLLSTEPIITPNNEVVRSFWTPLATLLEPQRQRLHRVEFRGETLERPAIDLLGPGQTLLWGITYRLVGRFLAAAGIDLPHTPIP